MISRENFTKCYETLIRQICLYGHDTKTTREVINASLCFKNTGMDSSVVMNDRQISLKYLRGELYWYLSGSNKLEDILPYSKFWAKISDNGKTSNSAYGYIMMDKFGYDQIAHVIKVLQDDPESRQAVIHIKEPSLSKTKDMNCTLSLQFFVRNNELHCITNMRSNDMWRGIVYDVPFFCLVQEMIANSLGVELGMYYHNMASAHIYLDDLNKHKKAFDKMCDNYDKKFNGKTIITSELVPKYEYLHSSAFYKELVQMHERVISSGR